MEGIKIIARVKGYFFSAVVKNETLESFKLGMSVFINGLANRIGLFKDSEFKWISDKNANTIQVSNANEDDWGHMNLLTNSEFIEQFALFLDNLKI